ncbi:uncharacterized protein LOC62_06G007898 [Vanrija pseudolonga]|uniref:Peptidase A1 domain-containing protein n=1 Tax=Vanrija pseudolonga TaxID=143232 RepID=A0AAF1BNG2_9TREE|nr:hypothetical protein LOC62_06G007898 [Vanrija pseudolonga]
MRLVAAAVAALLVPCAGVLASPVAVTDAAPLSPFLASSAQTNTIPMPPQGIYMIGVTSPLVQLGPTGLGSPAQTWNMSFTNVTNDKFVPGMIGLGQASFITSLQGSAGATVHMQFVGTGLSLLGSAGLFDALDWRVDGVPYNPESGTTNWGFAWAAEVAWARNLPYGLHNVSMVVTTTYDKIMISEAMVITGIQGATLTDSSTDPLRQITPAVDGTGSPNKLFQTTGQWDVYSPNEGDVVTRQAFPWAGYTVLRTNNSASFNFVLPKRTSYVEVWGSTGWGFANYTVTITPSPPFNPPVITYSAQTAYYVPVYILSSAILDPAVDYQVEYKCFGGGTAEIYNVQYFLANTTSSTGGTGSSSGVSVGALAGGIAGALVVGLAIAGLIGFAYHRSYKKKNVTQPMFEVESAHDARPEPFYATSPEMQGYADGELGLGSATATSLGGSTVRAHSPVSPRRSSQGGVGDDATSSGAGGDASSPRSSRTTFKSPRLSIVPELSLPLRRANAPLPVTVQERDSGAHVIHIVEYVPPPYDASLRATTPTGTTIASPAATLTAPTATSMEGTLEDDPIKPGGVRPLPSAPN